MIFFPICDHPGCRRREARSIAELMTERGAHDHSTPKDATWVYLPGDADYVSHQWFYACDVHQGDTSEGVVRFSFVQIRRDPARYATAPPQYAHTNWVWTHHLIIDGHDVGNPDAPTFWRASTTEAA